MQNRPPAPGGAQSNRDCLAIYKKLKANERLYSRGVLKLRELLVRDRELLDTSLAALDARNKETSPGASVSSADRAARKANEALLEAAEKGDLEAMRAARSAGATESCAAFHHAAACGRLPVLELLREWGAHPTPQALGFAAEGNHMETVRALIEWEGMGDPEHLLFFAARGGCLPAMRLAREEAPAADVDRILWVAANCGRTEAMRLVKEWGATDYVGAYAAANDNGRLAAAALALQWCQEAGLGPEAAAKTDPAARPD